MAAATASVRWPAPAAARLPRRPPRLPARWLRPCSSVVSVLIACALRVVPDANDFAGTGVRTYRAASYTLKDVRPLMNVAQSRDRARPVRSASLRTADLWFVAVFLGTHQLPVMFVRHLEVERFHQPARAQVPRGRRVRASCHALAVLGRLLAQDIAVEGHPVWTGDVVHRPRSSQLRQSSSAV